MIFTNLIIGVAMLIGPAIGGADMKEFVEMNITDGYVSGKPINCAYTGSETEKYMKEPIKGLCLLFVNPVGDPSKSEAFVLFSLDGGRHVDQLVSTEDGVIFRSDRMEDLVNGRKS